MSQLALFLLPEPPPALSLVVSEPEVEREDWTPDADDAYRLAELVCEQVVEDLAGDDAELRWDAECWIALDEDGHFAWAAWALGVDAERLEAQIREQVRLRQSRAYWHRREIEAAHNAEQAVLALEDAPVARAEVAHV